MSSTSSAVPTGGQVPPKGVLELMEQRNALSILAYNRPGVLVKVATVISGHGLNIHEMTARNTEDPDYTLIHIDFLADAEKLKLVRGQLLRLEVVRDVTLLDGGE